MLLAVLVAGCSRGSGPETTTSVAYTDALVEELATSHPAARLIAEGATTGDAFADAARSAELAFVCASGPTWEFCMVAADGVLAFASFSAPAGLIARLSDPSLTDDIVVPLNTDRLVGVRNTGPQARVTLEYLDQWVGEVSAPLSLGGP